MTDPTARALIERMANELDGPVAAHPLATEARAYLAAEPQGEGPTDDDLLGAVRHLYADQSAADMGAADDLRTARAVLARWGCPAVPSSGEAEK